MHSAPLEFAQIFHINGIEQMLIANSVIRRLLLACLLGGSVGLGRAYHKKPSGIRTNLLICLGCALFTVLSQVLSGEGTADKSRVASNIVQGIGFLGAGLIIHNRHRVSGLTSAAGVFVVAAIGMACGAGLYMSAIVTTVIVLVAFEAIGFMEVRFNLRVISHIYEVRGSNYTALMNSVLDVMDKLKHRLQETERETIGDIERVSFPVSTNLKQHAILETRLAQAPGVTQLLVFPQVEED